MDKLFTKHHHIGRVLVSSMLIIGLIGFFAVGGLLVWPGVARAAITCNVMQYGATGGGVTKDTTAIQNAINTCAGSGTVVFPSGTYLTAPLFLKSNTTLDIQSGATILGSETMSDYTVQSGEVVDTPLLALLNSDFASNITIEGSGVINGQGSIWWSAGLPTSSRPRLVEIANGSNVRVSGVTLENAGAMHLYLKNINNALVNYVTISAPSNSPNTDGIDPAGDQNVLIENSNISDGDDNVAIKANDAGIQSSNIIVRNCVFGTGHGMSIGNDLAGGVKNVLVENVSFTNTTNGLRIKSTRTTGGEISDVTYKNITMTNVKHPIWFSGYYPDIPADGDPAQPVTSTTPNYHDITVDGLTATGATDVGDIVGVTEKPFYNIFLKNVNISAGTGLVVRNTTVTVSNTTLTVSSGSAYVIQSSSHVITL
ncbi:MAG TPA: glycosyl hydrolase family 28 protein [Ktedonobacteraceae bacterium]